MANLLVSTTLSAGPRAPHPAPLQWRRPWWLWQALSWGLATITAPAFCFTALLLFINTSSDHPVFWLSLLFIVPIGNIIAICGVNQCHYRRPFTQRHSLALSYTAIGMTTGSVLFLLIGLASGFLHEVVTPMTNSEGARFSVMNALLRNCALALGFGILSFAHAGIVHAALCFHNGTVSARSA